jgi:hypothetical protein
MPAMSAILQSDEWNPLYLAYAQAHGRTPEEQLEHDSKAYPGGRMAGFICWVSQERGAR